MGHVKAVSGFDVRRSAACAFAEAKEVWSKAEEASWTLGFQNFPMAQITSTDSVELLQNFRVHVASSTHSCLV